MLQVRALIKFPHFICIRWIIPVCKDHNKGLSCKTFTVKGVTAVEAPPKFQERVRSWTYDMKKLWETMKKLSL